MSDRSKHANRTTRYGNGPGKGSITEQVSTDENKARVRELLIEGIDPKIVAKKLCLWRSLISAWRTEFLASDPEFRAAYEARQDERKDAAARAFDCGLAAAKRLAKHKNPVAAVQAAKILVSAPAELARAQSKIDVNVGATGGLAELLATAFGEDSSRPLEK